jgi:predicted DNA-binding transcriptional regulator AlpA
MRHLDDSLPESLESKRILNARQASKLLGVSLSTFRRQHWSKKLPPAIEVGERRLGWRADDLLAFMERRASA